jgi:hypothetical protein
MRERARGAGELEGDVSAGSRGQNPGNHSPDSPAFQTGALQLGIEYY